MSSVLYAISFRCAEPERLSAFWSALLGWPVQGADVVPAEPGFRLQFSAPDSSVPRPNRLHLHLTSTDESDQQGTVARVLDLGGRHLDVGQRGDEGFVVLADPEGNELCVIEPGNSFLAGTGFLGEVTCEGSREVGLFWSHALDWPLVWDQDEETAIQSRHGGTKVSWGGPPVAPVAEPARVVFELTADGDPEAERDRLVRLGATVRHESRDGYALSDPDGNEFRLRR